MSAPTAICNCRGARELEVQWPGERAHRLSHLTLRAACPCSTCRAGRLAGRIDLAPVEVTVEQVTIQGYGVQLTFSDGHDRGIYPWAYLRGL